MYGWLEHGFGTRAQTAPGERLATVKQVHSADVLIADHPGLQGTGDAIVCAAKGLQVSVKTADCLPILLVDPVARVVAAVHAGWRGTAQHIVEKALDVMSNRFGSHLQDVEAAIGPGIGVCCFQVGAEVAREFGPYEGESKTFLDLAMINEEQLAGTRTVYKANTCTFCGKQFWSFRREKEEAGRMISYIGQA